jgi:hypothetical protein
MALSIQSLESIWQQLQTKLPRTILEYGSGISTCLLAMFASQNECVVESFDSNEGWCEKTRAFLAEHALDKWVTISATESVEPTTTADFIIWDFDSGSKRELLMPLAYANLAPAGVMYVDDMQSPGIEAACNALGGERISDTPRDGFSRYGTFVQKAGY